MSRLLTFPPTQPPCSSLSSSSQVTLQTSLSPVVTRLSPFHFLLPPDQLQSPPDLSSLFQSPGYSSPSSILLPSSLLSSALPSLLALHWICFKPIEAPHQEDGHEDQCCSRDLPFQLFLDRNLALVMKEVMMTC